MKIKRVEINDFKRFSHLTIDDLPETVKLVILVGPNGCGKTSFFEALNHYYKYIGYRDFGDYKYLSKSANDVNMNDWFSVSEGLVEIDFYNINFSKNILNNDIKGHFYFRSAYRNEPDFNITSLSKLGDPREKEKMGYDR